jgi:hypothetical protein
LLLEETVKRHHKVAAEKETTEATLTDKPKDLEKYMAGSALAEQLISLCKQFEDHTARVVSCQGAIQQLQIDMVQFGTRPLLSVQLDSVHLQV